MSAAASGFDLDTFAGEVANVVMDLKAALGHATCDGWHTENGITAVYCGCGGLLWASPNAPLVRVSYPATATVTFEIVTEP